MTIKVSQLHTVEITPFRLTSALLKIPPLAVSRASPPNPLRQNDWLIEGELFTGDTMFEYGWGRTDLPGGNEEQMAASLRRLAPMVREKGLHAGH